MTYLIRVLLIIAVVIGVLFYMYAGSLGWVKDNLAGTNNTQQTVIDQVESTLESTLDLQWNIGEILDVEVENFKVQALVVDNHNGYWLIDSADLDLWVCDSMELMACVPSKINCEGIETFISLQKMPSNYSRCMKGY